MVSKIDKIFSTPDIKHGLALFNKNEIAFVEGLILEKNNKFFLKCQIRDKLVLAKPEEVIRQLYIRKLLIEYGYPKERITVERVIYFGSRDSGLADIVVLHEDLTHPYIIIENKRPRRTDGLDQLKSYCNADGAPIGLWSNGNEEIRLHRDNPNIFVGIPRIPIVTESLQDILTERWTLEWLDKNDELKKGNTTLKKIILDLEELVLANAGVDPFEEIFKLIYAKLFDEWKGINDSTYQLQFFVGDRSPTQVKKTITNLLDGAKRTWSGVFEPTDKIELTDEHLTVCVSMLEKIKLFNSNLRIIDEAFEYLIPQVSKKKEGQFFTPRPVEDMVAKMLNPKPDEIIIDPACGSAGFLLHSVMWIAGGKITGKELPTPAKNFAQNNIIGIDNSKKAVKIAKAINLIVGDGKSHIYKDNSLTPYAWNDETKSGLRNRLTRFVDDQEKEKANQEGFMEFDFDILMTNPPFAGIIKQKEILRLYKMAEKNGRLVNKIGRHILFLNRCIQMIRAEGRLAIVLPQGILNNENTEYIRRIVLEEARILAVVGLHGNTFKPHTGTKTSVLFLQKYSSDEKMKIQEIKASYEADWDKFFSKIIEKFKSISWKDSVDENEIPDELKVFIETYFNRFEEIDEEQSDDSDNKSYNKEEKDVKSLPQLIEEKEHLESILEEQQEKLNKKSTTELKKEVKTIASKLKKIAYDISERTSGGQIYLILNDEKIRDSFKNFWLEGKVVKKMDYPIFFAVNKKPLKDTSGDYIIKKNSQGRIEFGEDGHPVMDHDLDEIASAFVKFAKREKLEFWMN